MSIKIYALLVCAECMEPISLYSNFVFISVHNIDGFSYILNKKPISITFLFVYNLNTLSYMENNKDVVQRSKYHLYFMLWKPESWLYGSRIMNTRTKSKKKEDHDETHISICLRNRQTLRFDFLNSFMVCA